MLVHSIPVNPKDFFHQYGRGTGAGSASDQQIRFLLRFGGELDLGLLQRTVRAIADADPILRARMVETGPLEGRWELRDDDGAVPSCELAEVAEPDAEAAISAFLSDTEVRDEGPYVRIRVIRAGARDALCLRVDHRLCDGGGAKMLVTRLCDAYRRLAAGDPPPPRRRELVPRTLAELTGLPLPPPPPPPPSTDRVSYAIPRRGFINERPAHAVRVIEAAAVTAVRRLGKPLGATLNDAMITALARALTPYWSGEPDEGLVLATAADCRSRLPPGTPESICNLFHTLFPWIRHAPDLSFRDALAATAEAMGRVRARFTLEEALSAEAGFPAMAKRFARLAPAPDDAAERAATFVLLSNIGVLDPEQLDLGAPPLLDAQALGTIALLRELLVCASSFRGALTLSIGYCQSDLDADVPRGILDRMAAELQAFAAEG